MHSIGNEILNHGSWPLMERAGELIDSRTRKTLPFYPVSSSVDRLFDVALISTVGR
jgi:hypothetical protein